ncbi:PAS domain-containing sensor histidine kinase [Sphingobacterium paucimobilis]|uniref:histidine kinase n=1 Tax=Sphingobacterium paucimobilis HER1398 TaxID=1346330 RepID=U2HPU6_9SPHI|nr:PAS domain-containing sensor histidine kinase [Sphingobacterium paucimobilis]ERJ57310.1 hypothetical protein M472_00880 [Sphingobacterium paucimobilis HER1398]
MEKINLNLLDVLDHCPLATAIYDTADLRITYANTAMLDMWCMSTDILGQCFSEVFPGFTEEGFTSILEKVWYTGITYRATDTPAVIVDGNSKYTRYFDFEYKALVDSEGITYAILHTATDVTKHQIATSQLRLREEQLSFNNDLETLTYTLSHDLKNPLSIAKMGIGYLKSQKDVLAFHNLQWYDTIAQALNNVENIVNQTVQLSAARSIANVQEMNQLDERIATWCQEVKLLYPQFKGNISLGQLLPVYGDIGAIYQIFINTISNAVKYSTCIQQPEIEIYSEQIDKGVVYFIRDNGIGIPENELDEIFCVHGRGSNASKQQGTGIGLCLVKRLLERYRGTINISSKEGKGTLVRLFFPKLSAFENN